MKKLLIIEDDKILRETTAEILELENYEVFCAANGAEGIELAHNKLPDLIICDIMMPGMDGYEVLELLSNNNKTKHIPFIFMSAKTELKEIRKGMDLGADDYLTKPVEEELLLSAIESRLAKATLLRELQTTDNSSVENSTYIDVSNINDLKNYFCDFGKSKIYKKGEIIYREGEFTNQVYLIYKGKVKSVKIDEFGKELILAVYKDDDFFGFSISNENTKNVEAAIAMEYTEIQIVSKKVIKEILELNYQLSLEVFKLLNENLTETKKQLLEMAYGTMRRKTAQTILKFASEMSRRPTQNINISRRDLAGVAGIATESLIRTLSSFKKEGILEIEGRNIKILDLEKLSEIY